MILDGTIVNGDISATAAIADTKLGTISTAGKVSNSATTAASANTASAIVARDGSGNFTAGTITAALTGAASSNVLKAGDTMTGALGVTAGTAAAPSLFISGSTNTGLYSPGANQVAISTNGTGRLFVDASGRVGINTIPTVGNTLDIKQYADQYGIWLRSFLNDSQLRISNNNNDKWEISATYGASGSYQPITFLTSDTERLRITNDGLVGVGTSSPSAKTEIAYTSTNPSLSTNTGAGLALAGNSTVQLNFGTNPASPYNAWIQARDTGTSSAFPIALNPLGGNVGIGTTSPTGKLTLSGNAVVVPVALTDAATVAVDLSLSNNYTLTLGGNRTLGAPTNQTAGQSGVIVITNGGANTLAFASVWKFAGGTAPTVTASGVDVLAYYVESSSRITARIVSDVK
jgi:hypothetical protein